MAGRVSGGDALHTGPLAWDAACLAAIFGVSLIVAGSTWMAREPELIAGAVLVDLVLTSAVCHGLLGVRWGGLPAWTTLPVAAAGLSFSRWLLPADVGAGRLPLLAAILVEGAALMLLVVRVRTVGRAFRAARARGEASSDAFEASLLALGPRFAPVARWARLELEIWGFCFLGVFLRPRVCGQSPSFSHHRDAAWSAIAWALAMLVMVEGAVVHVWLAHAGYSTVMWGAFALHLYGLVWIVGDALALRARRTCLRSEADGAEAVLEVRVGLRARASIPLGTIVEIGTGAWDTARPDERLISVIGPANVKIRLERATAVRPMLGAPVMTHAILLQVDDPEQFVRVLAPRLPRR